MILTGTLESTTLGDLFGGLHRAGASGTLELREEQPGRGVTSHQVEFREGCIHGVLSPLGAPRLGELLKADGLIDDALLERVVARATQGSGWAVGGLACALGAVSESSLRRTLHKQRSARLEALFGVSRAKIRFHAPRPGPRGCQLEPLSPLHFLHGRRRARQATQPPTSFEAGTLDSAREQALRRLRLGPNASTDDARSAFRRLASRVHPDRFAKKPAALRAWAVQEFTELSRAYHTLAS